jgi:hypothetical protein
MMDGLRGGKEDNVEYWYQSAEAKKSQGINKQYPLNIAVKDQKNWPTVTATEARQGFQDRSRGMKGQQESLTTVVVKSWPTPIQGDSHLASTPEAAQRRIAEGKTTLSRLAESGLAAPDNLSSVGSRQESWLTPKSRDYRGVENHILKNGQNIRKTGQVFSVGLPTQAMMEEQKAWATPRANKVHPEITEANRDHLANRNKSNLEEEIAGHCGQATGKLNPRWVETLMGLPVGWVMPSCVNPITPQAEQGQSMGGGNWMTPEAQNSTGYQVSNGKKILRLGSQVMKTSTSPVTIEQTSCDSLATELFQQPQNSPLELSGRN